MIDYAENLCEAMKIILEKQIKQLSFDITIDATVVDATNAKNGMYVVSHDGATFTAYSTDSSFKEKDVVMVTIPQGNYDNQKMIIGKQVDKNKEEKPITYQSPFSQIVNLSGNLVYGDIGEKSLLANGGVGKTPSEIAKAQRVTIIEDNSLPEEYQTNGYTRLGLRADFSTWLNEFNVISGNYGLALTLTFKNPDNDDNIQAIYTFDSSEFFGDIYNFETYYNQEAVFDISDYSDYFLQGIKLEAYQLDNFKTSNGEPLSYDNMPFSDISKPTDNIFIKEPFICLGTAVGEFKKDSIKIVTDSSSTYAADKTENKNLKLKWTHQDLNSKDIYVVQEDKIPANYEIRWYKFELGKPSPDKFMDAHWVRFYGQNKTQNNDIVTNKINITFSPDPTNQTEQIRAIVLKIDNNNTTLVARSPIITFNNDQQILPDIEYIDANALGIQFNDIEKGKYYYYDKTGKKMSSKEKNPEHILKAVFDNNTNLENKGDLTDQTYTSIKWIFPKNNTMIIPLDPGGKNILESQSDQPIENNISPNYTVNINENNYEILFENENAKSILETMTYKIDDNFSFNKSRNTVYLEVVVNGQTYISSVTMFFGIAGTSGSDYTLVVYWGENQQELPVFDINNNSDNYSLKGTVKLLDLYNEEVTLNSSAVYSYNLISSLGENSVLGLNCQLDENNNNVNHSNFIISRISNNNISMDDLYILEIKLTGFGDYDLITKCPIALKNSIDNITINSITGTTMVRYASDGTITLDDKDPYSISFQNNGIKVNDKEKGSWRIVINEKVNSNFLPELIEINKNGALVEAFIQELKDLDLFTSLLYMIPDTEADPIKFLINKINIIIEDENQNEQTLSVYPNNMDESSLEEKLKEADKNKLKKLFLILEKRYEGQFYSSLFKITEPILSPPSIYFKDIPCYGVQYLLNDDLGNGALNTALYTQPIYVYQDNYPSTTINQWNGRDLILDEDKGTIVANGFSAGRKEDNNTFTGVMIGDWSRTDSDSSISPTAGIYGFHQGAMTYAFTDDGKAFIGKDGKGRIEFDGNNGIIKSAGFTHPGENTPGYGTLIDLNNSTLELYSPISDEDKNKENQEDYYLILSSGIENQPFLQINRKRNELKAVCSRYLNEYYDTYEELQDMVKEAYEDLTFLAQSYITLSKRSSLSTITDDYWKITSGLIPYTNYIFNKNLQVPTNLNLFQDFSELTDQDNLAGIQTIFNNNNVETFSSNDNIEWKFFNFSKEYYQGEKYFERLTFLEQKYAYDYYEELLQQFYKNPSFLNLTKVNSFIIEYIDEFQIPQETTSNNITNYYYEDVSILLDSEEEQDNNLDEITKQKKLIKFNFKSNSYKPLIPGEKDGFNYYLYNFFQKFPSNNSLIKKTGDSLSDVEIRINAINNFEANSINEVFYIKVSENQYTLIEKENFKRFYHILAGKYFEANEFWDNNNNYIKNEDGTYTRITNSEDFETYYIKKDNNTYIPFKYYFSTFTAVNNTTNLNIVENKNTENFIPTPIKYFENNRSYYYKIDTDEYIYTQNCDNNYEYFYIIINDPSLQDFHSIKVFLNDFEYYEIVRNAESYDSGYDQLPYEKYRFQFVSSVEDEENDNLIQTYKLESFILPSYSDNNQTIYFKVGNGKKGLLQRYRTVNSETYNKITIQPNQIYDITLRIDSKAVGQNQLSKDIWPIQGNFDETMNTEDDSSSGTIKTYYISLSFNLQSNVFGKKLLDSLIEKKYSSLPQLCKDLWVPRYIVTLQDNQSIRGKTILKIEKKLEEFRIALNNLLNVVPSQKQYIYKNNFGKITYHQKTVQSLPNEPLWITKQFILLDDTGEKLENLKKYLEKDISNSFLFDQLKWDNDLIKIVKNGGYITSKDYRPTMISGDKTPRLPIDKQDDSSSNWRQGMKGFIIDLSNNRIVLGNNSAIEGIQTQYYPGQTDVSHRYFSISTGVKFEEDKKSNRDRLKKEIEGSNKSYFIRARSGYTAALGSLPDVFYVRWNGYVFCESLRVHSNFYFGTDSNRVQSNKIAGVYDPQGNGNNILRFCDSDGNILSNIHVLCY